MNHSALSGFLTRERERERERESFTQYLLDHRMQEYPDLYCFLVIKRTLVSPLRILKNMSVPAQMKPKN